MEHRLARLAQRIHWLQLLCGIEACAITFGGTLMIRASANGPESGGHFLRAQGLIIEDREGRARIILGSPFPLVRERRRQDVTTEAMVFLDMVGNDRLILGEQPEPYVGGKVQHRIASSFAVAIEDQHGAERGGFGWLAKGRAVIALDRPEQDAWAALVDDRQSFAGTVAMYSPKVASRYTTGVEIGTELNEAFLRVKDTADRVRLTFQVDANGPGLRSLDEQGRTAVDLLKTESNSH
jgi:hypothetical protein